MQNTKTVLITGGARRIGAAIVNKLHQQGMNTIIHYRNSAEEAHSLSQKLNEIRANSAATLQADLNNIEQTSALIDNAINFWGKLDVIVNNASSFFPTELGEATFNQWHDLMSSNLIAPFFLTQKAIPTLKKYRGCIVNILDIYAMKPLKNYSIYCAAKAGLMSLTKSFALELAPEIRVNGIAPNLIIWPEGVSSVDDEDKQNILNEVPLKHMGNPDDIANCTLFLIEQPYITGEIIRVDGGRSLK